MAVSSPDLHLADGPIAPVIPNFIDDERVRKRYAEMLDRRIATFAVEHENAIRRNAAAKRDELKEQSEAAQAEWMARTEAAEATREAYRRAYPHHVKKRGLVEPTAMEQLRSLGRAGRLYHAAAEARRAAENATSNLRRLELNENQLEIERERALERAPEIVRDVTRSPKWLSEIHADEELARVRDQVEAIDAERAAYAERAAAGRVPLEELRLRTFAEEDIRHVTLPVDGLLFHRIDQFGPQTYFIMRDLRRQQYALPYDRRLEPLLGGVFDIRRAGPTYEVRPARDARMARITVLDHFVACSESRETAEEDERAHRAFVRARRMLRTMPGCDETESTLIELLAAHAAAVAETTSH